MRRRFLVRSKNPGSGRLTRLYDHHTGSEVGMWSEAAIADTAAKQVVARMNILWYSRTSFTLQMLPGPLLTGCSLYPAKQHEGYMPICARAQYCIACVFYLMHTYCIA